MKIKLLNVVVLAEDFHKQVGFYKNAFNLEIGLEESEEYHYCELNSGKQVVVGIAVASEMNHNNPAIPRNNTTLMQLEVSDIDETFNSVKEFGGKVVFGPSQEEKYNFRYGAVADPEGNQIWVVENTKL